MLLRSFCLAAAMLAAPTFAATPIDQIRPLAADGQVHIKNVKGRVVVRTWARPQVRITGSLGDGVKRLRVMGDARLLNIEVEYPQGNWKFWGGGGNRGGDSIIEVMLPQRASVDVDAVSADVDVQQVAGRKLSVSSVSGSILVSASSPGEASFENVSGDITARLTTSKLRAESVSGDVDLRGGLSGDVGIDSVSGDLRLATSKALNRLNVSTVSGDAKLQAALVPDGSIKGETLSGVLDISLPAATSARVRAESFSGRISSPSGRVESEEHGPGKSLDTTYGSGRGQIRLESFSGDVRIRLE